MSTHAPTPHTPDHPAELRPSASEDRPDDWRGDAHRAASSRPLRWMAQLGLLGYALVHVVVAWLAVQLAWHEGWSMAHSQDPADQAGAMASIARSPAGDVLLWLLAAGLTGLCVWQAVEVLRHHRRLPRPGRARRRAAVQLAKTLGTAVLYGYMAVSAGRTALGHGQGRRSQQHTVQGVLAWPAGRALVVAVALVVIAIGVYTARKGLRSDFLAEFDLESVAPGLRAVAHRFSQVGFVLKGVALVLVGALVGRAAVGFDAEGADGLDGALRTIVMQPYGRWLLTVVAVGLCAFAVYCLARARHPVG